MDDMEIAAARALKSDLEINRALDDLKKQLLVIDRMLLDIAPPTQKDTAVILKNRDYSINQQPLSDEFIHLLYSFNKQFEQLLQQTEQQVQKSLQEVLYVLIQANTQAQINKILSELSFSLDRLQR